jgi:hypothetical protein
LLVPDVEFDLPTDGEVDPRLSDLDGDGFPDAEEEVFGTDPLDADSFPGS